MSHIQQRDFIQKTKDHFPEFFDACKVLEVGSLNINGTVRDFFSNNRSYLGIDLIKGKDVDMIVSGSDFNDPEGTYDTTISTECFEHDRHWDATFRNMHRMTRKGGILIFTCASDGRHEHGTTRTSPEDSPATNDYYRNLNRKDFESEFPIRDMFSKHLFEYNPVTCDLYFWGIKK